MIDRKELFHRLTNPPEAPTFTRQSLLTLANGINAGFWGVKQGLDIASGDAAGVVADVTVGTLSESTLAAFRMVLTDIPKSGEVFAQHWGGATLLQQGVNLATIGLTSGSKEMQLLGTVITGLGASIMFDGEYRIGRGRSRIGE